MPKNIQLMIISHSFLKKINTDIYREFFKKFQIETSLISPKNLVVEKKILVKRGLGDFFPVICLILPNMSVFENFVKHLTDVVVGNTLN